MPRFQSLDGAEIYYKRWGHGRPVVLIHGWPLQADAWDEIGCRLVENGFQVIAYDRRGFGRSDHEWTGYDYDSLTDDLSVLIRHLSLKDFSLVGFSMGGGEAIRYARRHGGDGLRSLVLVSAITPCLSASDSDSVPAEKLIAMKEALALDRGAHYTKFFKDFFNVHLMNHPVSYETLEWFHRMAMQASLRGALECIDSFGFTDFQQDLVQTSVPVLLVHGEVDQIVPCASTAMRAVKLLKDGRLITYPDASHGICITHREELLRDLIDFLGATHRI